MLREEGKKVAGRVVITQDEWENYDGNDIVFWGGSLIDGGATELNG